MTLLEKSKDIMKKYKQHKACEGYVQGFGTLYEDVMKICPKSKSTLDVGCAYGTLALMFSLRGDKATALDINSEYLNTKMFKDNNIEFQKCNIEKNDIKGTYDLITMTETIEHLNSNPLEAVKRLYHALNEDGTIIVTTVAREIHGDTTSMNTGEKGLWNDLINWRDIPEYSGKWKDQHTFHYSQLDLVSLFKEAGFEIEDCYILNNYTHLLIGRKTK